MELPTRYTSPPHEGIATNSVTTQEFAELARVSVQAIYDQLWRHGNYLGVKPTRLPNKRLRWNRNDVISVLTVKETTAEASQ